MQGDGARQGRIADDDGGGLMNRTVAWKAMYIKDIRCKRKAQRRSAMDERKPTTTIVRDQQQSANEGEMEWGREQT